MSTPVTLPSRRLARRAAVCAVATSALIQLVGAGDARAGSFTWNNTTGNWSDPSRWTGGVAPTGTDPTDVLWFGGAGPTPYTATNDRPPPFLLNQLVLDSSATEAPVLNGAALRFEGPNPRVLNVGPGGMIVSNPVQVTSTGLTFNTLNFVRLNGAVSGAGTFTKVGPGNLTLAGTNTFSGPVHVNGGQVYAISDAALGDPTNVVTLGAGTLALEGVNGTRPFVVDAAGGRIDGQVGPYPFNVLGGNFTGPGALHVYGGNIRLTGTNTHAGGIKLDGALEAASDASLGAPGAPLEFTPGVNVLSRQLRLLGGASVARPIVMSAGGTLRAETPLTLSGPISGSGTLTLRGHFTLAGTNTFTTHPVMHDTIVLGSASAWPTGMPLDFGSTNATFDLNGFDLTVPHLSSTSTSELRLSGGADLTFGGDGSFTEFHGTVTGNGRLIKVGDGTAEFSPNNTGGLEIRAGRVRGNVGIAPLLLNGGTFQNLSMGGPGGFVTYGAPLEVLAGGGVLETGSEFAPNQSVAWAGPVSGNGSLTKRGTGALRFDAASNGFQGTLVNAEGTMLIRRTASFTDAGAAADVQAGTFGGAGSFAGHVTIRGGATLSPGDAPGQPGIIGLGQLSQVPGSNLRLQIAGRDNSFPALAEFDVVNAAGSVNLAGALRAELTGGFTPAPLEAFTVMTWASRTGRFDAHDVTGAPNGFTLAPTYGATALTLTYARFGDADLDGTVNLQDFNALAANFGAAGAGWAQGDFTGDGTVNLLDFNRLAANFGQSAAGQHVTPADWAALASAVPEPATGVVLGAVLLTAFAGMRRRRSRRVGSQSRASAGGIFDLTPSFSPI